MRIFCVHTCHYVAIGSTGTTVAPSGAIVTDMDDTTISDFKKIGAVREPTENDEASFAEAMKRYDGKLPGARSPLPGKPLKPAAEKSKTDDGKGDKAKALKKAKAHAASLAEIAKGVNDDPEATDEAKAKATAEAKTAQDAADALAEADIVG